jgi:hypothetical protein
MKSLVIAVILFSTIIFQNTFAQDNKTTQRKGFIFGTSLGNATTFLNFPNKNQTDNGVALDFKFGYKLNPNLAILITTNVSVYDYSGFGRDRKRDFGILAPSVQYWLKEKVWIQSGLGLGGDNPVFWDISNPETEPLETKYYNGVGLFMAFGYEFYQKKNFIIDIKAKLSYRNVNLQEGSTSGFSTGILIGINFN